MPKFRCFNDDCRETMTGFPGFDFEGELPICPKCKADGRTATNVIAPVVEIHYLVSDATGPIKTPNGNRLVACDPKAKRVPRYASGEVVAVTCAKCLASQVTQAHVAGNVDQHQPIGVPTIPAK